MTLQKQGSKFLFKGYVPATKNSSVNIRHYNYLSRPIIEKLAY